MTPPRAVLAITASGGISLASTISVTLSPIVFGDFRLESSTAGGFTATLNGNGLTIPSGARLLYKGVALTTPALPQITIAANGDFSVSVTAGMTAGLRLSDFPINNVSFTLTGFTLANGNLTLSNTGLTGSGNLSIANLGAALTLSGKILADGSFSLTQTLASQTIYGFAVKDATYTLAALAGSAPSLTVALNANVAGISAARFNGTVFADGLMDLNATLNSSTVAGHGLTSISLNFAHSRNSTAAATLSVSGDFNLLGVNRRLSGTISTGGSITMSLSGSLTLDGFTLTNGNLNLTSSGFTISGNLSITGLSPTLSLSGIVLGDGLFVMNQTLGSQSFFGFSAQNVRYSLTANPGGNVALSIDTMNLNVAGLNAANFSGAIRTDGFVDLRASPSGSLTLAGFGFNSVVLDLDRTAGSNSTTTLSAAGDLKVPNVPVKRLSGSISTSGAVNLGYSGSLTLGGFAAANGSLTLTSSELSALGTFNIAGGGTTFSSGAGIVFSGSIPNTGEFTLTGSGSLKFGSLTVDSFDLTLKKTGLYLGGSTLPQLNVGGVKVPFNVFWLDSSGLREFSGSKSSSTDWKAFGKKLDGSPGHPYAKLDWNVSAAYNPQSASIQVNVGGTLSVEIETRNLAGQLEYPQESFGFGPKSLGTDGAVSVSPGKTLQGISLYSFTIP